MRNESLGQVFTSDNVADYMVSLFSLGMDCRVLDPCSGGGAFLKALKKKGFSEVTGCEIDANLFSECQKKYSHYSLYDSDFLTHNPEQKYDGIIMNPPYIRQEKIDDLAEYGITKQTLMEDEIYEVLPKTANLYMYFVVKSIELLRNKGELVAIFPGSWLQARSGESFKEYLESTCGIAKQVNIFGEVFEKDALVEVVILKLVKGNTGMKTDICSYMVSNYQLQELDKYNADVEIDFMNGLETIGSVRRGLTTGCNEFFINPTDDIEDEFFTEIISTPKAVNGYSTRGARTDRLLLLDRQNLTHKARIYISKCETVLNDTKSPKTLWIKLKNGLVWYRIKTFDCIGIWFSYFVRNDMKFIINERNVIARDNFYVINPRVDKYLAFAALNNYYTYYQLETAGKKYGAGLLKLQRYDIENLLFPNFGDFSEVEIKMLCELSKKMIEDDDREIIEDITKIISKHSEVSYSQISEAYYSKKRKRLESA